MTSKAIVTDHALMRWLERVGGYDLDARRREILDLCAGGLAAGATCVISDKGTFILDAGKIVSVLPPGCRPGRSTTRERWFKEAAE